MTKYLTKEGFKKLKEELEYLKTEKRKEIAERLRHAASFGDISENAAYDEAKEAQAFMEGRIQEIKDILSQAEIIQGSNKEEVRLGSNIIVKSDGEKKEFQIVGAEEVEVMEGKISYQSPLGEALLGKKKGEKIKLKTPKGKIEYKIVRIE